MLVSQPALRALCHAKTQLFKHTRSKRLQKRLETRPGVAAWSTVSTGPPAAAGQPGMDTGLEQLIRDIHASPYKAVVYVTGGCAQVGRQWLGGCVWRRAKLGGCEQQGDSSEWAVSVCLQQLAQRTKVRCFLGVTKTSLLPCLCALLCCASAGSVLAADGARRLIHCAGGDCAIQQGQPGGAAGTGETHTTSCVCHGRIGCTAWHNVLPSPVAGQHPALSRGRCVCGCHS